MSNAVENGAFSPVKGKFYYSGFTNESSADEIVALFKNSHETNLKLALNYVDFLEKMLSLN